MINKIALLLVVCIKMFLSVTAQKQEIIDYMDSNYYNLYSYYEEESFDGWHFKKYKDVFQNSIYLVDTNLNILLETQIKTKNEMIEVMNTLTDIELFDTLMLAYYDVVNDEYKSTKYIQQNRFIPLGDIKLIPSKVDEDGFFSHLLQEDNWGDSIFNKCMLFEHDDFELEIVEEYNHEDIEYRQGIYQTKGFKLKLSNKTDSTLSLYIKTQDYLDFENITVLKYSNYVVVSYTHSIYSRKDNIPYAWKDDLILIHLDQLNYWKSDEQILWEETDILLNAKLTQVKMPYSRARGVPLYNTNNFTLIAEMFSYLDYNFQFPEDSIKDLSKKNEIKTEVLFNRNGIATYSIKTPQNTYTRSFFAANNSGFLEFEDVFKDINFVDNYIKQQLICIDSNKTYIIGDHFIDKTIKPDNFDDIKKQTYYTYHLLRYELLYIDKQGVNIRLRFKQMNEEKPYYLYFNIELSYKECRGQLTPLILEALRPKFSE